MTKPDLGPVGLWTFTLDLRPAAEVRDLVPEIESMGWGCVWVPEAVNRDAMVNSALLLSASTTLKIGTGIASIWGRDAMTTAAALHSLSEAWPGRFVLGLGVSHQPMVDGLRGQDYTKPFSKMRDYLAAMEGALYMSPRIERESVVLAALGPKMLELSASAADGAHPYFVPVEHTATLAARLCALGDTVERRLLPGKIHQTAQPAAYQAGIEWLVGLREGASPTSTCGRSTPSAFAFAVEPAPSRSTAPARCAIEKWCRPRTW